MTQLRMLGWIGILRLGLVQTALGAVVVLTTSTLNRIMAVELALPAILPGILVALHYAVQMSRPRMGYGSDRGGRGTPWIVGGMAVLALGGFGAAAGTALTGVHQLAGIALSTLSFMLIGAGVGAAGTNVLVILAKQVEPARRPPAAAVVWIMMILGLAMTAGIAGQFLDPYSPARLMAVAGTISVVAFLLSVVAILGVEGQGDTRAHAGDRGAAAGRSDQGHPPFLVAFKQVMAEPQARRFTIFVFVSMLAYNLQDLILEPFAGDVFGMTPGQSTTLSGMLNAGVLAGMITVGVAGYVLRGKAGSLRHWAIGGCLGSAAAFAGLVVSGQVGAGYPLTANVIVLGFALGAFAVAAIGTMMNLAGEGREQREGVRMGMWGAAQAIGFGLGGFLGTAMIDITGFIVASDALAYGIVFGAEAGLFMLAAVLAAGIHKSEATGRPVGITGAAEGYATGVGS